MSWIYGNTTWECVKDPPYYRSIIGIVVDWVIFFLGLPEVCLAGYALFSLLKKDRAAPIFAINLLLSDLLQISVTFVFIVSRFFDNAFLPFVRARCVTRLLVHLGISASLNFMVLISVERYLMVAYPVWYHTKNNAKVPILVSTGLWAFSLTYATLDYILLTQTNSSLFIFSIICLLPAPLLVGFFTATWMALHKRKIIRREGKKRQRVLGALSLVLGIYIVLFLPFSFRNLYYSIKNETETEDVVRDLSSVLTSALVYLSPLVDPFIYVFVRKDIKDTMEAFPCCRRPLACQHGLTDSTQGETSLDHLQSVEGVSKSM